MIINGMLVVALALSVLLALRERRRARKIERNTNRRLVAYEGRLRQLGHSPERVYHDFENELSDNASNRGADEFESDVRYEREQ